MGVLFSIFLIIAFGFVFNSVQANTITGAMVGAFGSMGTMNLAGSGSASPRWLSAWW